jgi:hypothetical protein
LTQTLLLKNNIKGTDTVGFRKNKMISEKWSPTIELICESREKRKKDIKKRKVMEKHTQELYNSTFKDKIL